MNKDQIIRILEENKKVLKKCNVSKIGLFGSYLKGKANKNSDIDLLVEFKKINADNYFGLWSFLETLFKNKKIDLVIERDLRPELQYVKGEVVYAKV